jgi:hypothetical protein
MKIAVLMDDIADINPKTRSAPKKDNQAMTILKEVAGATRTALGSTNSDNKS